MLTGTPVVTSTKDLAQQLRIMGRLDDFGGPRRFATRFCSKDTTDARLSELNFLLWKTCYFRREKTLVLKELPEKIREYRMVELTNRKEYDEAERNLIGYLKNYMAVDDTKLKRAMRATAMVKIGICRRLSAKGKLKEGVEVINEALAGGHKVIVFTAHKDTVKDLQRYFPKSVKVTGEDSPEVKQKSVDKFQNNPDCRVIVLNIKSGGVGITLTAADIVLFLEYPWTASDCDQCECRAYRNGQKNAVTCIYLVGQNTFDERMQELVQKERVSSSLITGAEYNEDEYVVKSAIKYLIKKNDKNY